MFRKSIININHHKYEAYGSANPVTSIRGKFRALSKTTVSRAAAGCQHKETSNSPRDWQRIYQYLWQYMITSSQLYNRNIICVQQITLRLRG